MDFLETKRRDGVYFYTVYDNILETSEIDVIVHGCNCSGGFGRGIAGQIAKKYPEVKDSYLSLFPERGTKHGDLLCTPTLLGNIQIVGLKNGRKIVNGFTQLAYGQVKDGPYVSYQAIQHVARQVFERFPDKKIGFPRIGAGLAGGNWDIIRNIIEEEAIKSEVKEVYFFDYNP